MNWWDLSEPLAFVSNYVLLTTLTTTNILLACRTDHYKDTVGNTTCTQCPEDSSSFGPSDSLSDCQCNRSPGNAQDNGCYG